MVKLFKHQEIALDKVKGKNKVAFYLDMGLGKTFVASEKAKEFQSKIIVICQNSKLEDWKEHFTTNYNLKTEIVSLKTIDSLDNFEVIVVNYEKLYRDNYSKLLKMSEYTLIIDESSILGNPKTQICKAVKKMNYSNLILLSGTPVSGKYEKLYFQLSLLGLDMTNPEFNKTFLNQKLISRFGRKFYELDKFNPYKNVNRLKNTMKELSCVFMKTEDAFELPKQNFIDIKVDTSRDYKFFEKHSVLEKYDLVGDTTLTKRLGLRKLASYYNKNKLDVVKDLIESTEDRILIFYNFKRELEELVRLTDKPKSFVNGDLVDKENYENYDNSITFMQYQAGAKGHNMQKANKIIFVSPTEKCEDYMQALKRTHRIGQEKACFYYRLAVKDSIEEKIYSALERGEDYTDELFRKSLRE
ncbi:DEAD/DEAH box helicase [Gemella sp. 19428wG2_WT2a]|nr:DEAD/DEAH box helicase [Gemella sp. 19428wG2_WT2a]